MTATKSKTTGKAGTKKDEIAKIKKTEIMQSIGGLSLGGVADQIAKTQVEIQKKLSEVGTQVSGSLATLEHVNAAIEAKRQELEELHGIEATSLTLDELTGTIDRTRAQWAEEQAGHAATEARRVAELATASKREETEYQYGTAQTRRKAEDDFAAALAIKQRAETDRLEKLEKGWAVREGELKARENELSDLRRLVAGYPQATKEAVATEVAIATAALKANLTNAHTLAVKDHETNLKIAQNEKAARDTEITRLQTTIADLHRQLDAAHKSAQTVAEKALDSASGRAALETLQNSVNRDAPAAPTGGRHDGATGDPY